MFKGLSSYLLDVFSGKFLISNSNLYLFFFYRKAQENGNPSLGPTKIFLAVQPAQTQPPPLAQVSI